MTATHLTEKCLALAGVFQAADLVNSIASTGTCESNLAEQSVGSIFCTHPDSTAAVFGGTIGLRHGLKVLIMHLEGQTTALNANVMRYALALLYLERKIKRQPQIAEALSTGIKRAGQQTAHFPLLHANVLANLADLYVQTISTVTPRIIVHGDQTHLGNPLNANKIRALLLAGIRAAVLWKQNGGSRLTILFGRKALVSEAKRLLAELPPAPQTE